MKCPCTLFPLFFLHDIFLINTESFVLILFILPFPQGVKPASYNKVMDPEIKEIIGECICQKKEER